MIREIVNIAATTEKKSRFSLSPLLARFLPVQGKEAAFLWSILPFILLLLVLGVSFLQGCVLTRYLPFIATAAALATLRFRTVGLAASYTVLALVILLFCGKLPHEVRLWQMGVLYNLAVTLFILLLSVEESETVLEADAHTKDELVVFSAEAEKKLTLLKKEMEEREREFREEIERLKQEAETRRIERSDALKKCELIQKEITLLNAQKEEFIAEARQGRALSARHLAILEEERKKAVESVLQKEQLEKELAALHERSKEEREQLTGKLNTLQERLNGIDKEIEVKADLLKEKEILLKENGSYLEELEKELSLLEKGKLELEVQLKEEKIGRLTEQQRISLLEAEIPVLKEKEAQLKEFLLVTQENIIAYQQLAGQKSDALPQQPVEAPLDKEDKKAAGSTMPLEVQLAQLRAQFEEKSQVLSKTRKELFHTQTKLLSIENEQTLNELEPPSAERAAFEKQLEALLHEIDSLEEEVTTLEELVSRNLIQ